jgi:O-succinylbenzoic acid--CoA ligase
MKITFLAESSIPSLETLMSIWEQGAIACPINPRIPLQKRNEMQKRVLNSPLNNPEGLAALLFTSGSSGTPKIAGISHRSLLRNAIGAVQTLGLDQEDYWHLSLPLYHVGGIGTIIRCLLARAKVGIDGRKASLLSLVPTQLYRMLKNNDPILRNKKAIIVGGAPIPENLLNEAIERGLHVLTTWGMTETCSMMTLNGYVLPGREIKLSEDGEILVRGDILFEGYLQENGTFFRPMTKDGWFATGDLGIFESGRLQIKGRKDRLFIAYGENVQPEEIEKEILKIPGILQAIVVAISDPEAGALPIAFVEAEGDLKEDMWRSILKERLPSFKVPRRFLRLESFYGLKPNREQLARIAANL